MRAFAFVVRARFGDGSVATFAAVLRGAALTVRFFAAFVPCKARFCCLRFASSGGHLAVVDYLLHLGADAVRCRNTLTLASMRGEASVVKRLLDSGSIIELLALTGATTLGHLDVVDVLLHAGAQARDSDVLETLKKGHIDVVARLLKAGYHGSVQFWREVRKAGLAPRFIFAVPRTSFGALLPPIQVLWLRFHIRLSPRLRAALVRARDRLDRPPRVPLGTATPTRAQLIAHLQTAGRRFAREYWTEGIPLFFPELKAALGPVPDCFLFTPT